MTPQQMAQAKHALALGNEVRIANAKTIAAIKALPKGDAKDFVAALLESPGKHVGALQVARLLEAIRGVGPRKVTVLLRLVDVRTPGRRVRELTGRQRQELAAALRGLDGVPQEKTVAPYLELAAA